MKWSVVVAGPPPPDLDTILSSSQELTNPTPASLEAVTDLCAAPTTAGILVVGTDADLARVVSVMRSAGRDLPLSLIPNHRSDLLAMFGLTREGAIARIQSGSTYRSDLGEVRIGDTVRPFVAHVAATALRLSRLLPRRESVVITTPRRAYELSAWWVIAANAQHLAGRTIAPKAALTDGQLDLQVFGGSVLTRLHLKRLARRGLHLRNASLWRRSVSSGYAEIPTRWAVTVDGVPAGFGPFEVSTEALAFDLWV
jgi:hypothetical protein